VLRASRCFDSPEEMSTALTDDTRLGTFEIVDSLGIGAPPRPPVTHIDLILNWVDEVKARVRK